MSSIKVDPYKIAHLELNEWEYGYVMEALLYYQYHHKPTDKKLNGFIDSINLDIVDG